MYRKKAIAAINEWHDDEEIGEEERSVLTDLGIGVLLGHFGQAAGDIDEEQLTCVVRVALESAFQLGRTKAH